MKKRAHQTSKPSPLRNRPCRTFPAFFAFTFAIRSSSTGSGAKGNCPEARRLPFWMSTGPIGKDEPIGDFESQQQNENQKVKLVDIVGLGGSEMLHAKSLLVVSGTKATHPIFINSRRQLKSLTISWQPQLTLKTHDPPLEEIELSALKIFAIEGDSFDEQISKRFKNLAWLRWFEC